VRDHTGVSINTFNGLFQNGEAIATPQDHFSDCQNISFTQSSFKTRDGITPQFTISHPVRQYTFVKQNGESLIILDRNGNFYDTDFPSSPILTIAAVSDFAFLAINGRGYISPHDGSRGLIGEFIYVYLGDGTSARKIGGLTPTNSSAVKPLFAQQSALPGIITVGVHLIAVSYGDSSSNFSLIGPEHFALVTVDGLHSVEIGNIPIGPAGITQRMILMTKNISSFGGDQTVYQYWEALLIPDNTTTNFVINLADSSLTVLPVLNGIPVKPTDNNAFGAFNSPVDGSVDIGIHLYSIAFETNTGFITIPGPQNFAIVNQAGNKQIRLSNIPTGDSTVVARWILATKAIVGYNGNQDQAFFFLERIPNNVTVQLDLNIFDASFGDSADYLFDLFANPPAGVMLTTYHERLVIGGEYANPYIYRLSLQGDVESFNQVTGLLSLPIDGNFITTAQEYRDILYAFKQTKTYAFSDNGTDEPTTWATPITIDQGIGCSVHGIATILDSGGVNIDSFLVISLTGLYQFNGTFVVPELSFKIRNIWLAIPSGNFKNIQIMHDSIKKLIYISGLTVQGLLLADYLLGMTAQTFKWSKWQFSIETTTIALMNGNSLSIGSNAL
jgi:hypothetical protein